MIRTDWVPTRLRLGDMLGGAATVADDLAKLYQVTPRQIVEANGIAWGTPTINAWVKATGGVTLSNGQPVFSGASVILLPPDGPRPRSTTPSKLPTAPKPAPVRAEAAVGRALVVLGVAAAAIGGVGVAVAIARKRRKKHKP